MLAMSAVRRLTESSIPTLWFELPGHYRSGINGHLGHEPRTYGTDTADALIHVCPFRPLQSNFLQLVQQTLLRDWVPEPYSGAYMIEDVPVFQRCSIRGADDAYLFGFSESGPETTRFHMCLGLRVERAAALLELDAKNAAAWQRYAPDFDAMLRSLHIEVPTPFRMESANWKHGHMGRDT
jgi:hypothetical protein